MNEEQDKSAETEETEDQGQEQPQFVTADQLKEFEDRIVNALRPKAEEKPKEADKPVEAPVSYSAEEVQHFVNQAVAAAVKPLQDQMAPIQNAVVRSGMESVLEEIHGSTDKREEILMMADRQLASGAAQNATEAIQFAIAIIGGSGDKPAKGTGYQERRRGSATGGNAPPGKAAQKKAAEDPDDEVFAKHGI